MAEHDPDPQDPPADPQDLLADPQSQREVERLYRKLPREEPPAELDAKIRAEARSAAVTHPAPLVAPTGRRSWYFPVAAAAVIVLAVAVTWQVEREQSDDGAMLSQTAPGPELKPQQPPELQRERPLTEEAKKPQETPKVAPLDKRTEKPAVARAPEKPAAPAPFASEPGAAVRRNEAPAAADDASNQAPVEPPAGALSVPRDREEAYGSREERARQERPAAAAPAPPPQRRMQNNSVAAQIQGRLTEEPPERWLELIAQLRRERRHDEADKALAEFRKRYPDFKIPEATLEKLEKK